MTEAELLEAIRRVREPVEDGALTRQEIMEKEGLSDWEARQRIILLLKQGTIEAIPVTRKSVNGKRCTVTGYRLTGK